MVKYTASGKVDEQWLAGEVAKREGGKESLGIAQIKEVQRHLLDLLADLKNDDVITLLDARRKKK
ncbi:MAG: hypothetical protein ACP5E9_08830 [Candidatus Methanospirareceae archaeon]